MEGINNVKVGTSYNNTKKGAAIGVGVGALDAGLILGTAGWARKAMLKNSAALNIVHDIFESKGIDMSKTTVSKLSKSLSKKKAIKNFALWTTLALGVGLAIDVYKNNKAKKAQ